MKRLKFKKIDAFATASSSGNPAGSIYIDHEDELTVDEMLLIANQLKGFVNEVGYVCKLDGDTYKMKYYSSEREVEFCGHATIGIMYDLIKNDPLLLNRESVFIMTNTEKLKVENRIKEENSVYIHSPEPEYITKLPRLDDIINSMNMDGSFINDRYPISIINAGLDTLILPINGLENILKIYPDLNTLKDFCMNNKIDIITVFSDEVYDKNNNYRTRVFAPTFGYLEDPATGSGNSALGYYLKQNKIWESDKFNIEQNNERKNYNSVKLRTIKDTENKERIIFGGPALVRIEGEYIIP
ncbi:PhzF family phenazine biosynthesis protein [Spirochaetota bacterium]